MGSSSAFHVTIDTLDLNGNTIAADSFAGTVVQDSPLSYSVTIGADGSLSVSSSGGNGVPGVPQFPFGLSFLLLITVPLLLLMRRFAVTGRPKGAMLGRRSIGDLPDREERTCA